MPITFDASAKLFKLDAGNTTYAFTVTKEGYLTHLYYGEKIRKCDIKSMHRCLAKSFSPSMDNLDSRDTAQAEYACFGTGDFRTPSTLLRQADGHAALSLKYKSHRIIKGKPGLCGLPATFGKASGVDTLEVMLKDEKAAVEYTLCYSAFRHVDVIARSVRVKNSGKEVMKLEKAASMLLDIAGEISGFDFVCLPGSWGRERFFTRTPLAPGRHVMESARGLSSHQMNPSFCLAERRACEDFGRVYGVMLLYSGNFASEIELDQFGGIRLQTGINPLDFSWTLAPGETFQTPEAVMTVTGGGFGAMSRTMHDLIRNHLMRGHWIGRRRPILVNNWEATYFDFDTPKLVAIAKRAAVLGIDMLVLDDGWFGKRNNDRSGLGDWAVNTGKLKGGLGALSRELKKLKMKFGLWFEPEMISEDSDLYRANPDWCLHIPGRRSHTGRNQYVLDMGRPEVVDHLFNMICTVLDSADISYIKWDANRHLSEVGSAALPPERQCETAHRFMLGTYRLHEMLIARYPEMLIEGCSGGGGRFDAGMLYYVPQIWCSDDTDAVERLRIQYGTSLFYPCSSMGSHVSVCPNHQTQRTTPFATRGVTAMAGTFGYELDLTALNEEECAEVKRQTARYEEVNPLVSEGDLYRLSSPEEDEITSWMNVAKDRSAFVFSAVYPHSTPHRTNARIRLRGLDPEVSYRDIVTGETFGGDFLMNFGLLWESFDKGDAVAVQRVFSAE